MLEEEKPAADSAILVGLLPQADREGLGCAQRTGICERGCKTGHDARQKLQPHAQHPRRRSRFTACASPGLFVSVRGRRMGHPPESDEGETRLFRTSLVALTVLAYFSMASSPKGLSLIHISEPTRLGMISYAV